LDDEYYVYCYRDPSENNERIYVGKGKAKRAWAHLKRTDNSLFVQRLRQMRDSQIEPDIEFLCKNVDEELAYLVEEEAIQLYGRVIKGTGTLLNVTPGGGRPDIITKNTRQKLSENSKRMHADPVSRANYMAGRAKTFTPEWKANFGAASKSFWQELEVRQRIIKAQTEAQNRPEVKAKNIAMITEVHNRPEVKASKSLKMKAYWAKRRTERGTKSA
jgi:hypothetical protein